MCLDHEADKKINPELIQNPLLDYSGCLLDLKSLSDYDRASMTYFTDQKTTRQPRLNISFPLDVTRIYYIFTKNGQNKWYFYWILDLGIACCHAATSLFVMEIYERDVV